MSSPSLLRAAARGSASTLFRAASVRQLAARPCLLAPAQPAQLPALAISSFSTSARLRSEHVEETFEQFTAR